MDRKYFRFNKSSFPTAVRGFGGCRVRFARRRKIYGWIAAALVLIVCILLGLMFMLPRLESAHAGKHQAFVPFAEPVTFSNILPAAPPDENDPLTLSGSDTAVSMTKAYLALFRAWNVRFDILNGIQADEQARLKGLRLLEHKGTLVNLRRMNRPVMLTLQDAQSGEPFYVTILSLFSDRAEIAVGDEIRIALLRDITLLWTGEYRFLWRPPAAYTSDLKPGDSGPMVRWVNRYLAVALRRPAPARPSRTYAGRQVDAVREFQLMAGLTSDGIVESLTIASISGAAGLEGPLLVRKNQE